MGRGIDPAERARILTAAGKRSRESRWSAPGRARVIHPDHGTVVVPHSSNLAAIMNAAEVWRCDWAEITDANLDPVLGRSPAATAPYMATGVAETARSMLEAVKRSTGTDLAALPDAQPLLEQVILPILARLRYGLDGYQQFDWGIESSYLRLPVETRYVWLLGEELCRRTRCRLSPFDYSSLSCYVTALLRQVEYPVHPLRLVVTNAIGGQFAAITAAELKRRWPELIESIRPMELYEIRRLDRDEYDAVLLGHISDHSETLYGYNYDAPAATVLLTRRGTGKVSAFDAGFPEKSLPVFFP